VKSNKEINGLNILNDLKKIQNKRIKKAGCSACIGSVFIDNNFLLYPCAYLSKAENLSIGNINEGIIKEKVIDLKLFAKDVNHYEKCADCIIKHLCGGGCLAIKWIEHKNTDIVSDYICKYYKIYWHNLIRLYISVYEFITDKNNINCIINENKTNNNCV